MTAHPRTLPQVFNLFADRVKVLGIIIRAGRQQLRRQLLIEILADCRRIDRKPIIGILLPVPFECVDLTIELIDLRLLRGC